MFPFRKDKEGIKMKKSFSLIPLIIFAVAVVITLPLRILQYKNSIEPGTGFYTEVSPLVILFYVVIGLAFIGITVITFINGKKLAFSNDVDKNIPLGAVSFICALICLFGAVKVLLTPVSTATPVYTVTTTSTALTGILDKAAAILGIITGIYFAVIGASYISGKGTGSQFKIISLAAPLWCAIRLVARFTRTVSYIRVSDLLLEMLMLACMTLFFMSFAQLNSKVNPEGNEKKAVIFGYTGALLGFVVAIPRLVLAITGNTDVLYELSSFEIYDIGLALFSIVMVAERFAVGTKESKPADEEN